jgi:hypothetical protein
MLSAAAFQSSLDRFLAAYGEPVTLQRLVGGVVSISLVDIPAFIRGYTADEIFEGSGIIQGDSVVVISMTNITWAGGAPRRGDRLIIGPSSDPANQRTRNIESAALRPLHIGYDVQIRGQ